MLGKNATFVFLFRNVENKFSFKLGFVHGKLLLLDKLPPKQGQVLVQPKLGIVGCQCKSLLL